MEHQQRGNTAKCLSTTENEYENKATLKTYLRGYYCRHQGLGMWIWICGGLCGSGSGSESRYVGLGLGMWVLVWVLLCGSGSGYVGPGLGPTIWVWVCGSGSGSCYVGLPLHSPFISAGGWRTQIR